MKKLIILLATLSLSGCFYQTIDPVDINVGEMFCRDKGGVREITSWFNGDTEVTCGNRYTDYTTSLEGVNFITVRKFVKDGGLK